MSAFFRVLAASLVAGLACATGSVGAPATKESRAGEVGKGESELDVVARTFLGSNDRRYVRPGNAAYPWLTVGNVYFVSVPNRVLVVATLGDGKSPVRLTGDPSAVATFVSKQGGGKFIGFGALANLLTDVAVHPTGSIGTPDLLLDPRDLGDWMQGREKDPSVLKSLCTGIKGDQRENEWKLRFNVFNLKGGVDAVSASGTVSPFTIRQLSVTPVKPAGEFHYPFAG